jgi:hypothetical protein
LEEFGIAPWPPPPLGSFGQVTAALGDVSPKLHDEPAGSSKPNQLLVPALWVPSVIARLRPR